VSHVASLAATAKISARLDEGSVDSVGIIQFVHASAEVSKSLGENGTHTLY
jgi:hypothetical protein